MDRTIRRSPTLAQRAAQALIEDMRLGRLAAPDGLIPSEAILSQRLGVSRATLREAMTQLEQRGMVVRRQGVGTFVKLHEPLVDFGLEELESIEALAARTGVEIHMGECDIDQRPATAAEAERLGLKPAARVLVFGRVILSGQRRVAFLSDVVPVDLFEPAELEGFDGSVLDMLLRRGHPQLERSLTEICPEAADRRIADALRVEVGTALLRFDALLFAAEGRAIDTSTSYFVPGEFRFHIVRRVTQYASRDAGDLDGFPREASDTRGALAGQSAFALRDPADARTTTR